MRKQIIRMFRKFSGFSVKQYYVFCNRDAVCLLRRKT